ncbi:DNA-binding transcriptional LysR family regulator [Azonexus fungiphilus]|uniref:DNA-binding transcriptional LysR family regulator n=1 Tax=Azonexus fungiphilus TaxID=146940 RepID=A0A495WG60_9RHOO|nr:LysR family transcriptional regulator [Azonexus fungiphilus]RKT60576.1 DNA-binding transcriptional LysR family regulator [Azonexus fungiphilus]
MDRLDAMRLFVRVAELGSFSAVAQQLDLARSVVTRQIAGLESRLGVKLMARSTRRLSLTAAGAAYLEKCRVILNLVEAAENELTDENQAPRGHLRVSVPLSFGLKRVAPLLLDFARRYPEVTLDMDYSDRQVKLIEEGIDLSLRITRQLAGGDVARRIGSIRLYAVASPDYLARHGRPRHPAELIHHECLGYAVSGSMQQWQFTVDGQLQAFPVRSRIQANNGDVLVEAAAQGMGITLQPDFIVEEALAAGRVEAVLAEFPRPELGIHALLPGNRHIPHRVRVLIDFLANGLSSPAS